VVPARGGKPKDKAKVENSVLLAQRWILAVLRNRTFFSLAELNTAIRELLPILNARPMQKLNISRRELFEQLDRPAMNALPATRYEIARWKLCTVNIDYHDRGVFQIEAAGFSCSALRPRPVHHEHGAHAAVSSSSCGMDALPPDRLGEEDRARRRTGCRRDPQKPPAP
jgi:hypothetical protein